MPRLSVLLALIPVLALDELAMHGVFATRAPGPAESAALGAELTKLTRPGEPVVVAPAWAEPWVRQASPASFPLAELARAEDRSFPAFWEVSLLGQHAPELAEFPIGEQHSVGAFSLRRRRNPRPELTRFDFVGAVDEGRAEVFTEFEQQREPCPFTQLAKSETGGLHGHVAYPRRRYACAGGRLVGVTLIEDRDYRPRRCVLAQAPDAGSVVLRFAALPRAARLVGFVGASYFLERHVTHPQIELGVRAGEGAELRRAVAGAEGWTRFELAPGPDSAPVEVRVRRLARGSAEFCFSLEAR